MTNRDDGFLSMGALALQKEAQEQAALRADERRLTGGGCL